MFVHGLNGNPYRTWTSDRSKTFWPKQLLPYRLREVKARILVYGYDAKVTSFTDGEGTDKIYNHAEQFVSELAANRQAHEATQRPIILVTHALGGFLVSEYLSLSVVFALWMSERPCVAAHNLFDSEST